MNIWITLQTSHLFLLIVGGFVKYTDIMGKGFLLCSDRYRSDLGCSSERDFVATSLTLRKGWK